MIGVKRGIAPAVLADEREFVLAKDLHAEGRIDDYEPKIYKHPAVKRALEEMFHGKCAYCEVRYSASQPVDVEHYRPKSIYWWLAAKWENLLPSCIDCNRRRGHVGEDGATVNHGKADHFPLDTGHLPAGPEEVEAEDAPLLLNPTEHIPTRSLQFAFIGEHSIIRACGAGLDRRRGETTIDIFGLNRRALVEDRSEWILVVFRAATRLVDAVRKLDGTTDPAFQEYLRKLIDTDLADLKKYRSRKSKYTASARAIIDPLLIELGLLQHPDPSSTNCSPEAADGLSPALFMLAGPFGR